MARRGCTCGVCESSNLPSACTACVNLRLADKFKELKRLIPERDALQERLNAELRAKKEADRPMHYRLQHADRKTKLLECLHAIELETKQNRQKIEKKKAEYEARKRLLDIATVQLQRRAKDVLEHFYPDLIRAQLVKLTSLTTEVGQSRRLVLRQLLKVFPLEYPQGDAEKDPKQNSPLRIGGACLPVRNDPHSVSPEDFSTSLGYMVLVVNQVARYLSAPLLHNGAFAASSSRVWIRSSYWDERATSRSEEYPLFLPRKRERSKNSANEAGAKSDAANGGSFFTLEKPKFLRSKTSGTETVPHESDRDVRQGLQMLKRSIACVCAYGYTVLLGVPIPCNMSTFEAFVELLTILSSKENKLRVGRTSMSGSTAGEGSLIGSFSSHILDSEAMRSPAKSRTDMSDFFCIGADLKSVVARRGAEAAGDEWDVIEYPTLPPPSQSEDVQHWERAMITDATK